MGKSTADQLLRARGLPVIDTDLLARELVEPGQPALTEIKKSFGPSVIASNGHLNRGALASLVFADPARRKQLEAILHPRIRELWRRQIEELQRAGTFNLAVVVIPLLFETEAQAELDATLCVACSAGTQRQRLQARGWSLDEIQKRNQTQWPVEEKMAAANFVVWTEGSLDIHATQLERIVQRCA